MLPAYAVDRVPERQGEGIPSPFPFEPELPDYVLSLTQLREVLEMGDIDDVPPIHRERSALEIFFLGLLAVGLVGWVSFLVL